MHPVSKVHRTILALLPVVLLTSWAGESRAQFILYDDFSGPNLDPSKWRGVNRGPHLESFKRIQSGQLLLGHLTYAESSSDTGGSTGRTGLRVADSNSVNGIAAQLTMLSAVSEDCAANDVGARAVAQLQAAYFNVGTSTGPDDRTGDVISRIQLMERDGIEKVINIRLEQCNDPDCNTSTILAGGKDLVTAWDVGETHFLLQRWDPDNDRVLYLADTEWDVLSYGVPDNDPPSSNGIGKRVRAATRAENCTTGPHRLSSSLVSVDNFLVLPVP